MRIHRLISIFVVLSLLALASVKNRPEIWEQRHARMVNVEFIM